MEWPCYWSVRQAGCLFKTVVFIVVIFYFHRAVSIYFLCHKTSLCPWAVCLSAQFSLSLTPSQHPFGHRKRLINAQLTFLSVCLYFFYIVILTCPTGMPIRPLLELQIWLSVLQEENAVHGKYGANQDEFLKICVMCCIQSSELEFYIRMDRCISNIRWIPDCFPRSNSI